MVSKVSPPLVFQRRVVDELRCHHHGHAQKPLHRRECEAGDVAGQFESLDLDDGDEKAALAHASIFENVL